MPVVAPNPAVLSRDERRAARTQGQAVLRRAAIDHGAWTDYRLETVTESEARSILLALSLDAQQSARDITQDLIDGRLTRDAWYRRMRALLVPGHYAAALAATGQATLDEAAVPEVERRIATQLGYLRRFQRDLALGSTPLDGRALVRADLYGAALWATGQEVRRTQARREGYRQERAVLSAVESCRTCLNRAAQGWVAIGTLVPLGESECRTRCKCRWAFRKAEVLQKPRLRPPVPKTLLTLKPPPPPPPGPDAPVWTRIPLRTAPRPAKLPSLAKVHSAEDADRWAAAHLETPVARTAAATPDVLRETLAALWEVEGRLGRRVPVDRIEFGAVEGRPGAYGGHQEKIDGTGNVIRIQGQWLNEPSRQYEIDDVRYRERTGGDVPFHAAEGIRGLVWHEVGHAVDLYGRKSNPDFERPWYSATLRREVAEDQVKQVSGYANSDWWAVFGTGSEAWAECFAAIATGSPRAVFVPEPYARAIRGILGESK